MHKRLLIVPLLASSLLLSGCISKSDAVRSRAAFDLKCDQAQLTVTPLSDEMMSTATYGVQGCDKRATYVYTPNTGAVLNSPIDTSK
jgi:hypothetical protein